jgi:hypothetical protein
MFGKYLNNVPNYVPAGFDAWLAAKSFSRTLVHFL